MIAGESSERLDRDNPWPGLHAFSEASSDYFHGRDEESAHLYRLLRRETLTVLFGKSGLGKTSLIRAGLFPLLDSNEFLPVHMRLQARAESPPLVAQIAAAIAEAARARSVEAPEVAPDEPLWEYFHRRDHIFWSARNRLVTPVLVFDQFEELFTLTGPSEEARQRQQQLLDELTTLVENRVPETVRRRLEHEPERAAEFDFGRRDYKILFCFREDFLPEFEGLAERMPSIIQNRLRLHPMSERQALSVLLNPGGHLIDEPVARQIVHFVAGRKGTGGTKATFDLEVEPALLSLVSRELNLKRQALGQDKITESLLQQANRAIISDFYERNVGTRQAARVFIEDHLITRAGYRDSRAFDDALSAPGVSREDILQLVEGRLLRLDERFGQLRIELTHDVLTPVVKASRDDRLKREQLAIAEQRAVEAAEREQLARARLQRTQATVALFVVIAIAAVAAAVWAFQKNREARLAQSDLFTTQALTLIEDGDPLVPKEYLARAIRLNPDNSAAVARAVTLLSQREHLPRVLDLEDADTFEFALHADSASQLLTVTSGEIRLGTLEPAEGSMHDTLRSPLVSATLRAAAAAVPKAPPDGTLTAALDAQQIARLAQPVNGGDITGYRPGNRGFAVASPSRGWAAASPDESTTVNVWSIESDGNGSPAATGDARLLLHESAVTALASSHDGRFLVTATAKSVVTFWDPLTGKRLSTHSMALGSVNFLSFSPNDEVVLAGAANGAQVLHSPDGTQVGSTLSSGHAVLAGAFSTHGEIATTSIDKTAAVWTWQPGEGASVPPSYVLLRSFEHRSAVVAASLSQDGTTLATGSLDGSVRVWRTVDGRLLAEPITHKHGYAIRSVQIAGSRLLIMGAAGGIGVWDMPCISSSGRPIGSGRFTVAALSPQSRTGVLLDGDGGAWLATLPEAAPSEASSSSTLRRVGEESRYVTAIVNRSGNRAVLANLQGVAELWDTAAARPLSRRLAHGATITALAISTDSTHVATGGVDGRVRVWDVASGRPLGLPLEHSGHIAAVDFSADGRVLLVRTREQVHAWLTDSTFPASPEPLFEKRASAASMDGKGERIVIGAGNKLEFLWLEHRGVPNVRRKILSDPLSNVISSVTVSANGRWVAAGTLDGNVRMWEMNDAGVSQSGTLMRHPSIVTAVQFSADSRWLLTTTLDHVLRVWDMRSGLLVADPIAHSEELLATQLSDDGNTLASVTRTGVLDSVALSLGYGEEAPRWLPELVTTSEWQTAPEPTDTRMRNELERWNPLLARLVTHRQRSRAQEKCR